MIDRRALLAAAGATAVLAGRAAAAPASAAMAAAVEAARAGSLSPGGMVVAAKGGETVAFHAWGKASLDFDAPVTARTLFHFGSNGKHVTAVAVMQLVEAGLVDPRAPVGRYVKALPESVAAVTVYQLLHQISGLPQYDDPLPWDRPQPREVTLGAIRDVPFAFAPGERWAYSNTNYLLLGYLIEDVSGTPYADYVRERLFAPAGLPLARPDAGQSPVPGRAERYDLTDAGEIRRSVQMEDGVSHAADGGLLFSGLDVAPWRRALEANRLISAASLRRMTSPGRLNSGLPSPYGMGFFLERARGKPLLWHAGSVPGSISWWLTLDSGLSIAAAATGEGKGQVFLTALCLAAAEALEPGSTYRDLPPIGDGAAARDRAALAAVAGNLPGAEGAVEFLPVDRWPAGDGGATFVRYRWRSGGRTRWRLIGFTANGEIYWHA